MKLEAKPSLVYLSSYSLCRHNVLIIQVLSSTTGSISARFFVLAQQRSDHLNSLTMLRGENPASFPTTIQMFYMLHLKLFMTFDRVLTNNVIGYMFKN